MVFDSWWPPFMSSLPLQENFCGSSIIVPDLEGVLYLKEDGKKHWKQRLFQLRASGIYYVPKGKTKVRGQRERQADVIWVTWVIFTVLDDNPAEREVYRITNNEIWSQRLVCVSVDPQTSMFLPHQTDSCFTHRWTEPNSSPCWVPTVYSLTLHLTSPGSHGCQV